MWLDTEAMALVFENIFMGCLSVLTITGTIYLCVKIIEKLNINQKDNKKAEKVNDNNQKLKNTKKAIRKMLKNEYGLIPTCNQPKETGKEVEA